MHIFATLGSSSNGRISPLIDSVLRLGVDEERKGLQVGRKVDLQPWTGRVRRRLGIWVAEMPSQKHPITRGVPYARYSPGMVGHQFRRDASWCQRLLY